MGEITICVNGKKESYPEGSSYQEAAKAHRAETDADIALVLENGKYRELNRPMKEGAQIEFVTMAQSGGHKCYVRTAILMMVKAIDDICGHDKSKQVKVEFAIGNGYYISPKQGLKVDQAFLDDLAQRMRKLQEQAIPITKRSVPTDEARLLFAGHGMEDKEKLFRFRRSSTVNVYSLEDYQDYYYGYMLPDTSYIRDFSLELYEDGFILVLPEMKTPDRLERWEPRPKLFSALKTADDWGARLGIDSVGDLNEKICAGELSELVLLQEALQERRIGEIAQKIVERGGVKFVMIAGPSSSGKTTFSHRLSVQLASYGMKPHPIGVDDYFKNRADTPKDEDGNYNFECLEAIDVDLFNNDMVKLLNGETVELPTFNFKTGAREYKGNFKTLGPEDILVIEGIHGLNDRMSHALPVESKFKIYISALTSLNIDEHNRIPTTDGRLLRRMVRDARTRGASAQRTISMWPSVRRGEEENIFPFQESADETFNSALIYELAVLKQFAEPLLFSVRPDEPEYHEAKRMLKFLEYFLGVSSEDLPKNSIVREFVGGSCFQV